MILITCTAGRCWPPRNQHRCRKHAANPKAECVCWSWATTVVVRMLARSSREVSEYMHAAQKAQADPRTTRLNKAVAETHGHTSHASMLETLHKHTQPPLPVYFTLPPCSAGKDEAFCTTGTSQPAWCRRPKSSQGVGWGHGCGASVRLAEPHAGSPAAKARTAACARAARARSRKKAAGPQPQQSRQRKREGGSRRTL